MIIQGSFPGGRPHSTILLSSREDYLSIAESARTLQALMRHPNNMIIQEKLNEFKRENYTMQSFPVNNGGNVKAYPLNIARLNFQIEGLPMEDDVLQMYESFFDVDLSDIMIHEGEGEAEAAGALAFAAGNDIYFADGLYDPYSHAGIKLLGHEITHVLQQKEGRVKNPFGTKAAFVHDPIMEVEAERMGINALAAIAGYDGIIQMMNKNPAPQYARKRKRISLIKSPLVKTPKNIIPKSKKKSGIHKQKKVSIKRLAKPKVDKLVKISTERKPTLYTYLFTKPENKLGLATQGPHTIAHCLVDYLFRLGVTYKTKNDLVDIFTKNVPSLSEVKSIVETELSSDLQKDLKENIKRYLSDYDEQYNEILKAFKDNNDIRTIRNKIREIMEMHPYQTYSWDTGLKASHSDLKGKGEGGKLRSLTGDINKIKIKSLRTFIDTKSVTFTDKKKYKGFMESRLQLGGLNKTKITSLTKDIN